MQADEKVREKGWGVGGGGVFKSELHPLELQNEFTPSISFASLLQKI